MEFNLQQFRALRAQKADAVRQHILIALRDGRTVTESVFGHTKEWALGVDAFCEPYKHDAAFIADHLVNRWRGFASVLTVDGIRTVDALDRWPIRDEFDNAVLPSGEFCNEQGESDEPARPCVRCNGAAPAEPLSSFCIWCDPNNEPHAVQ